MARLTEGFILKTLNLHAPIKASGILSKIKRDFPEIQRKDINSILYKTQSKGLTKKNSSHEWTLTKKPATQKTLVEITTTPSLPAFELSSRQQVVVDLDMKGTLLVRGQAGCGKTTVLAARAGRISSIISKGTLLFLTYNAALKTYVERILKERDAKKKVHLETFHGWAKKVANSLDYKLSKWIDNSKRIERLTEIMHSPPFKAVDRRFYKLESRSDLINWWSDEIAWIFGEGLGELQQYQMVERTGRGKAFQLTREEREDIWKVFIAYRNWLEENCYEDFENPGGLIDRALQLSTKEFPMEHRYDHVFVDEVQDFHKSWLRQVARIPSTSLNLAGDLTQRIYKRSFTWKSVGIQIQANRSHRLTESHRTTLQIMRVAMMITKGKDLWESEDGERPVKPSKEGDMPKLLIRSDSKAAYRDGYQFIVEKYRRLRTASVAVALPFDRQVYSTEKKLQNLGINAVQAKRQSLGRTNKGIVVTTYHQLKGLEFDHVIIMGLEDENFPGGFLKHAPEEDWPEEEVPLAKLLYVAVTRAKQSVTLIGGQPFCRFFDQSAGGLIEEI
jgi:superfamily I DNA/RNA helicase